ncbi:MAG: hypothetical protein ABI348_06070 [Nitrososphaera sp.]
MAFAAHAFLYRRQALTYVVAQAVEKLRCNVCDVAVDMTSAKEHSASREHALRKQKLEGDLKETAARKYGQDSSVVVQWAASIN